MKHHMTGSPPGEDDLNALVEGVLDHRRQAEIERYLMLHPSEARRIAAYRMQKARLSFLLHETAAPPAPVEVSKLGTSLALAIRRQRRFLQVTRAAAAAFLLVAAISTGWLARDYASAPSASLPSITQQAVYGYRLFAENDGFASSDEADTARDPLRWLSQRAAGQAIASPDLKSVGFELLDSWLFPTALGEAVQLLYRDGTGQLVTLYVVYGEVLPQSTFSHVKEGDLSLLFWRSGSVSYCIVGRLSQAQLVALAEMVTAEIGGAGPPRIPDASDQAQTVESGAGNPPAAPQDSETVPAKAEPAPTQGEPPAAPAKAPSQGGASGLPTQELPVSEVAIKKHRRLAESLQVPSLGTA